MVGYAQDVPYLTANVNYFSYDGHYFYQNEHQMYDDYKANTYAYPHAVNAGKPYYNYFQYLTHRASSNYSAQEFDAYTNDIVGSAASQMKGLGTYYVSYGQTYGVNALMAYAVSCNESAYGKSEIAMTKTIYSDMRHMTVRLALLRISILIRNIVFMCTCTVSFPAAI